MKEFFFNPRGRIIQIIFGIMALVLIGQLLHIQVLDDRYKVWASDQAIYRKVVYPARGVLQDRYGQTLMYNQVTFDLTATPNKVSADMDTAYFCSLLDMPKEDFAKKLQKVINKVGKQRAGVFETQLSTAQNARLQENLFMFPGFEMVERTTRSYPKPIGSSFMGYIAEISPKMLENEKYSDYRQGDYIGLTGLESVYEKELRGTRGVEYLVRDVMNRPRDSYNNGEMDTAAKAGATLGLYLDRDLQELTEDLMKGKMGSAIALDPNTGGVLAMVSAPTYDPNLLSGSERSANIGKLFADATTPMFNRAIQAKYPPGSTFKPITALIGLDVGAITPSFGYPCAGGYYACGKRIGCTHSGGGHAANLSRAIQNSCNSYFCHVFRLIVDNQQFHGVKRGVEVWHDYLNKFGFGRKLGIDVTGENPGFIPDSAYFNNVYNNHWNSCQMVTVGMGQGELEVTPLQMANAMCLIANEGYYYTPHFVRSIDGDTAAQQLKPFLKKNEVTHIPQEYFKAVKDGMEAVVTSGTGRVAALPGIEVCGKTGTVENYAMIRGVRTKLDNHSVFVCFAPKDHPKIAIAVIVSNSGYGGTWAGPVATLMMEKYLLDTIKRKPLKDRMENAYLIKPYIKYLDSVQRAKDIVRDRLRYGNKREIDSLKRSMDTMLVQSILDRFGLKPETPAPHQPPPTTGSTH